jgi:hypothetical protein
MSARRPSQSLVMIDTSPSPRFRIIISRRPLILRVAMAIETRLVQRRNAVSPWIIDCLSRLQHHFCLWHAVHFFVRSEFVKDLLTMPQVPLHATVKWWRTNRWKHHDILSYVMEGKKRRLEKHIGNTLVIGDISIGLGIDWMAFMSRVSDENRDVFPSRPTDDCMLTEHDVHVRCETRFGPSRLVEWSGDGIQVDHLSPTQKLWCLSILRGIQEITFSSVWLGLLITWVLRCWIPAMRSI